MASQTRSEFDQRPEAQQKPPREKPDFAVLAQQFPNWGADNLEIMWDRYDEIQTVSDFRYFLFYCRQNELDPTAGEVAPLYRWNPMKRRDVLTPIVTIGALRKRRAKECDGLDEFKFTHDGQLLVSASGTIYRKGCAKPFSASVWYDEYAPRINGQLSTIWVGKAHMLLSKCLEAQLTRLGFFDLCGEFLVEEETAKQDHPQTVEAQPKTEEFQVGEKKPAGNEVETKQADAAVTATQQTAAPETKTSTETKAAVTETTAPITETKQAPPVTQQASGETPTAQRVFTIKMVVVEDGKQTLQDTSEQPQNSIQTADLRATALAKQFGTPFVVKDWKGDTVLICNPPSGKPAPVTPLPAAAASVATPAPTTMAQPASAAPVDQFDQLITAVTTAVGGVAKDAHQLIARYFRSFLEVKTIPKDRTKLMPALTALATGIDAARVTELKVDPEALGVALAGRPPRDILEEEFTRLGWSDTVRAMALQAKHINNHDAATFINWIGLPIAEGGISVAKLEAPALEIFLPLYLLVKGDAFQVIDWAIAHKRGVTHTLVEMVKAAGIPIAQWDTKFAEGVLAAIATASGEAEAQPQAAAAAPANAPPADEWLTGGLPFD